MSAPKVTGDSTREVHHYRRTLTLAGGEPLRIERAYSHGGKLFLPETATASWDHGKDIQTIVLQGLVLKKDGTPGVNRTDVAYCTPANYWWGKAEGTPAPGWLLDLFGIQVPGA